MLGKKGLTSTEASRISNFIKELVKGIDVTVDNFKVTTSTAKRDGQEYKLDTATKLDDWKQSILKKAEYYSLSAWLKEGVKYKDSLITEKRNENFDESTVEGLDPYPTPPVQGKSDFDTYLHTLNVKEISNYYTQEALSSHVGQFIHNFDKLRKKIDGFEPTTFSKISDTETLTVTNKLLYDTTELLDDVETLTSKHREADKHVNYVKAKHKEFQAEVQRNYLIENSKYRVDLNSVSQKNNSLIKTKMNEFEIQKTKDLESLASLKITIPNDLQPILDEVLKKLDK